MVVGAEKDFYVQCTSRRDRRRRRRRWHSRLGRRQQRERGRFVSRVRVGPEIQGLDQFARGVLKSALSVKCCPALILNELNRSSLG